ncbi:hypothetical protein DFQ27_003067 [Actinomortierella ambigua]|uniref:Uncharacterized protein n=1 Tax=Actinomortierella ambigua TaxID=1343610 RepID=A0A9P6QA89_9FUNG|nr:hypothetical protein DFQ27_003067 [Actinomortierella ambigua]
MANSQTHQSFFSPLDTYNTTQLRVEPSMSKNDSDEATVVQGLQSQIRLLQEAASGHQREVERVSHLLAQAEQRYEEQVKITDALERQLSQWSSWLQAAPCTAAAVSVTAPPPPKAAVPQDDVHEKEESEEEESEEEVDEDEVDEDEVEEEVEEDEVNVSDNTDIVEDDSIKQGEMLEEVQVQVEEEDEASVLPHHSPTTDSVEEHYVPSLAAPSLTNSRDDNFVLALAPHSSCDNYAPVTVSSSPYGSYASATVSRSPYGSYASGMAPLSSRYIQISASALYSPNNNYMPDLAPQTPDGNYASTSEPQFPYSAPEPHYPDDNIMSATVSHCTSGSDTAALAPFSCDNMPSSQPQNPAAESMGDNGVSASQPHLFNTASMQGFSPIPSATRMSTPEDLGHASKKIRRRGGIAVVTQRDTVEEEEKDDAGDREGSATFDTSRPTLTPTSPDHLPPHDQAWQGSGMFESPSLQRSSSSLGHEIVEVFSSREATPEVQEPSQVAQSHPSSSMWSSGLVSSPPLAPSCMIDRGSDMNDFDLYASRNLLCNLPENEHNPVLPLCTVEPEQQHGRDEGLQSLQHNEPYSAAHAKGNRDGALRL